MLFVDNCSKFKASHHPVLEPQKDDFLFCYKNNEIGLLSENQVPLISDFIWDLSKTKLFCFGSIDNRNCFLWNDSAAESKLNFAVVKWICSSLLGFTAKYVAGDIRIDQAEIEFANWFDESNLPALPYQISLSRYLIERYLEKKPKI